MSDNRQVSPGESGNLGGLMPALIPRWTSPLYWCPTKLLFSMALSFWCCWNTPKWCLYCRGRKHLSEKVQCESFDRGCWRVVLSQECQLQQTTNRHCARHQSLERCQHQGLCLLWTEGRCPERPMVLTWTVTFLPHGGFRGVHKRTLRFFRPVVAHCPESFEEVWLNPSVALNVSCKMNAAMQDVDIDSKYLTMALRCAEWRSET